MANHTIKVWPRTIEKQSILQDSLIAGYLSVDYCDFFSRNVVGEKVTTSDEFSNMAFDHSPGWVNGLMKSRSAIVRPLGLEVGMCFVDTICEQNAQEIVFGMPNKHLAFHTSLQCGKREPGGQMSTITTVVEFNNRLGRLYFFFIRPSHKVIIRSMLKRVAERLKQNSLWI